MAIFTGVAMFADYRSMKKKNRMEVRRVVLWWLWRVCWLWIMEFCRWVAYWGFVTIGVGRMVLAMWDCLDTDVGKMD